MSLVAFDLSGPSRLENMELVVDGASKVFGAGDSAVTALTPISLAIGAGEFLSIVGPSGCGKSTLLNLIAGFETPSSGEIRLDGKTVTRPGAERGVVFQQGSLFPWMTVLDNVSFGPISRGVPKAEAHERARQFIDLVHLSTFATRYPYELSGGMQQRVGIARALANEPRILLMDEPFASLDQQTREILQFEIKRIWQRTKTTIFWITHSIDEALFLSTHVAVMSARPGRIKKAFASEFFASEDPMVGSTQAFTEAKREVTMVLHEESMKSSKQEEMR
jgi:ABC-type nitrate/sulfonate/bicarbonate transport system ATPase subunit